MEVLGERVNAHLHEYSTLKSFGIFSPKRFEPECSSSVVVLLCVFWSFAGECTCPLLFLPLLAITLFVVGSFKARTAPDPSFGHSDDLQFFAFLLLLFCCLCAVVQCVAQTLCRTKLSDSVNDDDKELVTMKTSNGGGNEQSTMEKCHQAQGKFHGPASLSEKHSTIPRSSAKVTVIVNQPQSSRMVLPPPYLV